MEFELLNNLLTFECRNPQLPDPSILLLDEPTSGLDSTSAVALMKILDKLAREEGKTIITSIHQPSSAVFFAFDKLMLLADGNVVYFGTPNDSLEYVKMLKMECPAGYNAVRKLFVNGWVVKFAIFSFASSRRQITTWIYSLLIAPLTMNTTKTTRRLKKLTRRQLRLV